MKDLFELKREFLEYCELDKGQSALTIANYERYLDRFLKWLEGERRKAKGESNFDTKTSQSVIPATSPVLPATPSVLPAEAGISQTQDPRSQASGRDDNIGLLPESIDQETVRQYKLYVNRLKDDNGRELKKSTQNYHILALRAFLRYLAFRGIKSLSPEKITIAKTGDREITFLESEELQRLLEIPDTTKLVGLRDRAILELLFSTGMRVSELAALDIDEISFERGEISVLGKGKKLRVVFLSESALYWLDQYIKNSKSLIANRSLAAEKEAISTKQLAISSGAPVFLTPKGGRLTIRTIQRIVERATKKAGVAKHVSPHTLRHSFATDLLINGADVRSVQSLLGHSSITTTQVYTHVTDQHLRDIHKAFHGKTIKPVSEMKVDGDENANSPDGEPSAE